MEYRSNINSHRISGTWNPEVPGGQEPGRENSELLGLSVRVVSLRASSQIYGIQFHTRTPIFATSEPHSCIKVGHRSICG